MSGSPRIPRQREQDNDQQRDDQRQTEDGQHEQPQQGPGSTSKSLANLSIVDSVEESNA